ncbi:MAG: adenylate/guanylate cyclase domain-containing protein [Proteobacteria bacterium]|nr:adenylate/guanylate cyclase domain-containing protein [Pseudomonadota bacterium]
MTSFKQLFAFRSFRTRLVVFLLALLIPVLGGIFYYVNTNNTDYTEETINTYLALGADVFDYTRAQQASTLQSITSSLTWDYGFRTAFGANAPATLFDAALNVLERSLGSVDMLMIVDLESMVIIDTQLQGFDQLQGDWLTLVATADQSADGIANAIVTIDAHPFQLIALPLYLPRQVAWIIGGFALDSDFVGQVKETIRSEVSIVRVSGEGGRDNSARLEVIASTLSPSRQAMLGEQLRISGATVSGLQRIDFIDAEFTTLLRPLYGESTGPIQVLAVIQRSYDENNENVVQFEALLIRFYGVILVVSLLAVLLLGRSIANPLTRLAQVVRRIEAGDYQMQAAVTSQDELGALATSVNSMAVGLAEKEKVRDLLGKVVSHQIAEELLNNPVELGGEERMVTVLFSDIRGFTSFCEGLPPQQVLGELNRVLSTVSDIIEKHHGVVDKFQGDAVMALFGAPVQSENDAPNAMQAALEIIRALEKMDSSLGACVGINTGLVVAGNLGSSSRLNYSVIGDAVNLAARLESLTRLYNVPNIVSEESMQHAPQYAYREIDEVRVAGKRQSVKMFELMGRREELHAAQLEEIDRFQAALALYRQKNWKAANEEFSALQQACENKLLCQVFLDRIAFFEVNPPAADWQGVFTFDKK